MEFQIHDGQDRVVGTLECDPRELFMELGRALSVFGSPLVAYEFEEEKWQPYAVIRGELLDVDEDDLPGWVMVG
jgi:hypothetical protein